MKKIFLISLILSGCFCQSRGQDTIQLTSFQEIGGNSHALTLEEALRLAALKHPLSVNAQIKVDIAQSQKKNFLNLKPTEISYTSGRLFSNLTDHSLDISQNFGSPLTWIARNNYEKKVVILSQAEQNIDQKELDYRVKSAYYQWLYQYSRLHLYHEQRDMLKNALRIDSLHFKPGTNQELEKTLAVIRCDEIQNQLEQADYELSKDENKLKQLILTDDSIRPSYNYLPMYMMVPSNDTINHFSNTLMAQYSGSLADVKEAAFKVEKSRLFPEIIAGYFRQSINQTKGYYGWHIGISLPLWFHTQLANINEQSLQYQMSINELEYEEFNQNKNIENLVFDLTKYYKQLIHYNNYTLKQADLLIKTTTAKYKNEDIPYSDFIQSLDTALKINMDYLDLLNKYNQTAIHLEFYSN